MLFLMRRTGEIIRFNKKTTIKISEIQDEYVTFVIEDEESDPKEKNSPPTADKKN